MTILNNDAISSAYFYPQMTRCEDVVEVDVGSAILRCHHHQPNPGYPTLVHFHGNGEAVAPYVSGGFPSLVQMRTRGMNTLMIEYRGYGGSTGDVELVSMLSDGEEVLKALNIDPSKSIAYGRSIGSLYAIELARRCPTLAALVIDSGIADIRIPFLEHPAVRKKIDTFDRNEVESEIATWFNHEEKLSSFKGRLVLFHTRNDGLIEVENAYRLYRWATSKQKQIRVYHEGNHNTIFQENHDDMINTISELADSLFPECKFPPPMSIAYRNVQFEGVDVGCPMEDGENYMPGLPKPPKETEQPKAERSRRFTEDLENMVDEQNKECEEREAQLEISAAAKPRSVFSRILNFLRRK